MWREMRRAKRDPQTARGVRRPLFLGLVAGLLVLVVCPPALARPGDLDGGFSTDGKVLIGQSASSISIQPDGKLLIAGTTAYPVLHSYFFSPVVWRYLPDGRGDPSWGSTGTATLPAGAGGARYLALQSDERVVVTVDRGPNAALMRLNPDGALDSSFADGGVVGDIGPLAGPVAVQADGGILAASGPRLARYLGDGSLDGSFENSDAAAPGLAELGELVVQPDGRLLVAGGSGIARYTPDGSLDQSFGTGGRVIPQGISPRAMALQADGKIVVGASASGGMALIRYAPDGQLDPSFEDQGVTLSDLAAGVGGIAIDSAGRIAVAGGDGADGFRVLRFLADGSPDRSFGEEGVADPNFAADFFDQRWSSFARDLVLQDDGKIVAAGFAGLGSPGSRDLGSAALARFEVTPGPPNADADSRLDPKDRCPQVFGRPKDACPVVGRSLSARRSGTRVSGWLEADRTACMDRQAVKVFSRRPGRDKLVGRDRTGKAKDRDKSKGQRFSVRTDGGGAYYAKAPPKILPPVGRCAGAKSKRARRGS